MTLEERIQMVLGAKDLALIQLQHQLTEAQAELNKLKPVEKEPTKIHEVK